MKGWVYVISTRTHNLLKVGYTDRDPNIRAKELNDTSSPHPHLVEYAALVESPREIERQCHQELAPYNEGKEWFNCDLIVAVSAIRKVAKNYMYLEECNFEIRLKIEQERVRKKENERIESLKREKLQAKNRQVAVSINDEIDYLSNIRNRLLNEEKEEIESEIAVSYFGVLWIFLSFIGCWGGLGWIISIAEIPTKHFSMGDYIIWVTLIGLFTIPFTVEGSIRERKFNSRKAKAIKDRYRNQIDPLNMDISELNARLQQLHD